MMYVYFVSYRRFVNSQDYWYNGEVIISHEVKTIDDIKTMEKILYNKNTWGDPRIVIMNYQLMRKE